MSDVVDPDTGMTDTEQFEMENPHEIRDCGCDECIGITSLVIVDKSTPEQASWTVHWHTIVA